MHGVLRAFDEYLPLPVADATGGGAGGLAWA